MRRTLILDAHYQPVKLVSWQKAICYVYLQKCTLIEEYSDFTVRSVNQVFAVPKVIQVKGVVPKKELKVQLSKRNVHKRDHNTCAYCNKKFKLTDLTLDHIVPLCKGGENRSWLNLISACYSCNGKKGGRTPEEAQMKMCFQPYQPKWSPKQYLDLLEAEEKIWSEHLY